MAALGHVPPVCCERGGRAFHFHQFGLGVSIWAGQWYILNAAFCRVDPWCRRWASHTPGRALAQQAHHNTRQPLFLKKQKKPCLLLACLPVYQSPSTMDVHARIEITHWHAYLPVSPRLLTQQISSCTPEAWCLSNGVARPHPRHSKAGMDVQRQAVVHCFLGTLFSVSYSISFFTF